MHVLLLLHYQQNETSSKNREKIGLLSCKARTNYEMCYSLCFIKYMSDSEMLDKLYFVILVSVYSLSTYLQFSFHVIYNNNIIFAKNISSR